MKGSTRMPASAASPTIASSSARSWERGLGSIRNHSTGTRTVPTTPRILAKSAGPGWACGTTPKNSLGAEVAAPAAGKARASASSSVTATGARPMRWRAAKLPLLGDPVAAGPSVDAIVARPAADQVVAAAALDPIVARQPGDHVAMAGPLQRLTAARADDRRPVPHAAHRAG